MAVVVALAPENRAEGRCDACGTRLASPVATDAGRTILAWLDRRHDCPGPVAA